MLSRILQKNLGLLVDFQPIFLFSFVVLSWTVIKDREIEECTPGRGFTPAGVVGVGDGLEVLFEALATFFDEDGVIEGGAEEVFFGEGEERRVAEDLEELVLEDGEVGVALFESEGAEGKADGDVVARVWLRGRGLRGAVREFHVSFKGKGQRREGKIRLRCVERLFAFQGFE